MGGNAPSPDSLSPRYTEMRVDQVARNESEMQRHFYRAGEKIDGSVIQHYPGTEIMVVDFSDNSTLEKFYNKTLAAFAEAQKADPMLQLPIFFYNQIRARLEYDRSIIEGLISGDTQEALKQHTGLYQRMGQRADLDILDQVANTPPIKDHKFSLGNYAQMGYGVCRQQAAMLSAFMERAIAQGKAPGWKQVELRANLQNPASGHAWTAMLNENGVTYIYDPAQNYLGPETSATPHWNYQLGYENHQFGVPGS